MQLLSDTEQLELLESINLPNEGFMRVLVKYLSLYGNVLSKSDIDLLQDKVQSRIVFKHDYPILLKVDDFKSKKDQIYISGNYRYYSTGTCTIQGTSYYYTSQLYGYNENTSRNNNRITLFNWICKKLHVNAKTVSPTAYYPSIEEYDPQISSDTYERVLSDYALIKPSWLDILHNLYEMGGTGSCKEIENRYGLTASHYNANAINLAKIMHRETKCKLLARENGEDQYWPILFYAKDVSSNGEGSFCYKLREPLFEAIRSMEAKGVFTMSEYNKIHFDLNMILYGPPGTGKTYTSAIYAVAICEGKPIDDASYSDYGYVMERYHELKKAGRIAFTTFHQSYGYEDFIESISPVIDVDSETKTNNGDIKYAYKDGTFKEFCKIANSTECPVPYVFIIDEINRGNISKIFGELITLIEDSKRKGNSEEISAILPYSKEEFSVPNNVYIIGTMNTADRSIALMDTALRRRFHFIEMMPKSELLKGVLVKYGKNKIDVEKMLEIINERIAFLYDREHMIGHAFFMGLINDPSIDKLAGIFEKSIIPLLQEYFYEDYRKIQIVLGDNGKDESKTHVKFIKDTKLKVKDVFKGNLEDIIDLPEYSYEIDSEALRNVYAYKEIGPEI